MVVDAFNEIASDAAVAHACIGGARRLMVADRCKLREAMEEAVQNHAPEVVVVDGIATAQVRDLH